MCPPGYRHNGIIAAHELGHTMYGVYIYIYIYIYIYYIMFEGLHYIQRVWLRFSDKR